MLWTRCDGRARTNMTRGMARRANTARTQAAASQSRQKEPQRLGRAQVLVYARLVHAGHEARAGWRSLRRSLREVALRACASASATQPRLGGQPAQATNEAQLCAADWRTQACTLTLLPPRALRGGRSARDLPNCVRNPASASVAAPLPSQRAFCPNDFTVSSCSLGVLAPYVDAVVLYSGCCSSASQRMTRARPPRRHRAPAGSRTCFCGGGAVKVGTAGAAGAWATRASVRGLAREAARHPHRLAGVGHAPAARSAGKPAAQAPTRQDGGTAMARPGAARSARRHLLPLSLRSQAAFSRLASRHGRAAGRPRWRRRGPLGLSRA